MDRQTKQHQSLFRKRPVLLSVAVMCLGLGWTASCSKDSPTIPPLGDNFGASAATTMGDYRYPFDTVPSSDGSTLYFTATSVSKNTLGVFSVPSTGGVATTLFVGAPLVDPHGLAISSDDKTLFIADGAAGYDPSNATGTSDLGGVFSMSTSGGTPTLIAGTAGLRPRGIDVAKEDSGDVVYFSGQTISDGKATVFRLPAGGGNVAPVFSGAPLTDVSGVAVSHSGTTYVANVSGAAGSTSATIFQIQNGSIRELVSGILVGNPAGVSLSQDDKTLLVSGQDRVFGTSVVYRVNIETKAITQYNQGLENSPDSGGLHRARNADVFGWAGVTVGDRGIVFRVEFK
jgi:hypothetical protein